MPPALHPRLAREPVLPRLLRPLPKAQSHAVFTLSALLERTQRLDGPAYHAVIADMVHRKFHAENEMQAWLEETLPGIRISGNSFSMACEQANRWLEDGWWVATWKGEASPPSSTPMRCPRVLFGKGGFEPDQFWSAFFNSRKAKALSPRAEWIQLLRTLPSLMVTHHLGIACSVGTATYDLVAASAEQIGARVLLLIPEPLAHFNASEISPFLDPASFPRLVLSCLTKAATCPKPTRMVCRDRLLALVSDLHCVLELRSEGNLFKILEEQQKAQPRPLWIYRPKAGTSENAGNVKLLELFSHSATGISTGEVNDTPISRPPSVSSKGPRGAFRLLRMPEINWQGYLYHYVRPCPGPWPSQSYRNYLKDLLHDEPLAGHSALDTLARILTEKRVRASSRIVRGDQPVISWTPRPPLELSSIRRWNRALMRWTLEPYGLAVKRLFLKERGAKPAVYGSSTVYQKLSHEERFRFQLHEPPRCSWKNEREWRLPNDLELTESLVDHAFGFVSTHSDAETLARQVPCVLPIVVLGDA
jgi:hypothetical protein